jgi:hypothetical protein
MKERIKRMLAEALTHSQINDIVDEYGLTILLDNSLSNALRDARVRVEHSLNAIEWEVYQLN